MKAMFQQKYGSPDELKLTDVDKPVARDHEVLVRIHAAGLHVGDGFGVKGTPLLMRMATGLLKPKYGVDMVRSIGADHVIDYLNRQCSQRRRVSRCCRPA